MVRPILNVTVCGGGRTGHLNAILFAQRPSVSVTLLTRNEYVLRQHLRGTPMSALLPDGGKLEARLDAVTSDAATALAEADVVVITVPAQARPQLLRELAPHLPRHKPVLVGAIPGFCGFDWLAEQALAGVPNAVIWGMKDVPHTAFELRPGVSVRMGGPKSVLYVAAHERERMVSRQLVQEQLQRLYEAPVRLLDHYLEITLTPGNPIMHSSVIYGLIGPYAQWYQRPFEEVLCWWSDCSELGAYFLERSDEESQLLCRAIERRLGIDLSSIQPLKQEIIEAYGEQISDPRTMLSVLRTNRAYADIVAPMQPCAGGYEIDRESRAFHEDVAFGLSLLVEMARRLELRLPHIEEIFDWNVRHMGGMRSSALDYFPPYWPRR